VKLKSSILDSAIWHSFDHCFIRKERYNHPVVRDFIKTNY
jgi:hypothetical protein